MFGGICRNCDNYASTDLNGFCSPECEDDYLGLMTRDELERDFSIVDRADNHYH